MFRRGYIIQKIEKKQVCFFFFNECIESRKP